MAAFLTLVVVTSEDDPKGENAFKVAREGIKLLQAYLDGKSSDVGGRWAIGHVDDEAVAETVDLMIDTHFNLTAPYMGREAP